MSLKALIATMKGGNVLIPLLQDFTAKESNAVLMGKKSRKAGVIQDAKLTIAAMKSRIEEFNHGEIVGDYFHPSQLGGCLRSTWFAQKGKELLESGKLKLVASEGKQRSDTLKEHLIFETGTYFHIFFMNLIERAGIMEDREVAIVDKKERILGHCDVVIKIDGTRYGVELKTISGFGFTSITTAPKFAHKIQAHAYMKPLKLEWMIILYFCKDNSELKEHVIHFDSAFYKEWVSDRIDKYFRMVKKNILPEREEGVRKQNCNYCAFRTLCFDAKATKQFINAL